MVPSLFTAGISDDDAQARATSSITIAVRERVGAGAAVLLGHVDRVQVGGHQRVVDVPRELRRLVDLRGARRDLVLGERAHRLPEQLVLLGQRKRDRSPAFTPPIVAAGSQTQRRPDRRACDHVHPRLTVLGTGYLGATHAVCMAELGYEVLGLDVDADKIDRLAAGEVPFFEPGLDELLRKNLATGRLRFTTSYERGRARSATCTSSASARRRRRASTPPTCATSTRAIDACSPRC